jgi:hypothetical protein
MSLKAIENVAAEVKALRAEMAQEVKAVRAELTGLVDLKNRGSGAIAGIVAVLSVFGALIIMGVVAFIKDVVK